MKSSFALLAFTAFALPFAARAGQIVNINALSQTGTTLTLAAGTYQVSVIGTSQGGKYNGWDYDTTNYGTPCAKPGPGTWVDSFDIIANGVTTSYVANGNPRSNNALDALAAYQSSVLNGDSGALNSAIFTLTSAQSVSFTVADYFFADNWGGESLNVTSLPASSATPEPSTLGLMGLALVGVATIFRRKKAC